MPKIIVWTERLLRFLLGAYCFVAAGDSFFQFLILPEPPHEAQELLVTLEAAGYFRYSIGAVFFVSGILLWVVWKWIGFALTLLAPVIFNIVMYHLLLHRGDYIPALVLVMLYLMVCGLNLSRFRSLFGGR